MAERDFNLEMTGEQVKDALQQLEDRVAEGWAVGEHDGVPVTSGSPYYHNSSAWWAQQAGLSATAAASSAATAEQEVEEGIRQGIVGAYVQESATPGAIVTIDDGADNIPLKDLKVNLDIIQPLNGQANPYPAGGGANKWDEETRNGYYSNTGVFSPSNNYIANKNPISVDANAEYYFVVGTVPTAGRDVFFYDENMEFISKISAYSNTAFTAPANAKYLNFNLGSSYGATYKNDISINYPSTDTAYHPYENICPIYPVTEVEVTRMGVNLWDEQTEKGSYSASTGQIDPYGNQLGSKFDSPIRVSPSTAYCFVAGTSRISYVYWYDSEDNYLSRTANASDLVFTATSPANAYYMRFQLSVNYGLTYLNDVSVNYPATDTDYHAYAGQQYLVNIGINQWDEEWEVGQLDNAGEPATANAVRTKNFIQVLPSASYYIKCPSANSLRVYWYNANKDFISIAGYITNTTVTAPANAAYMKFYVAGTYGTTYNNDISINYPSRFTDYYAYTGHTVYGGSLDVTTGVLTAKYKKVVIDGVNVKFSGSWGATSVGFAVYTAFSDIHTRTAGVQHAWCDMFAPSFAGYATMPLYSFIGTSGASTTMTFVFPSTITSSIEANAWAAQNPITVVYELATPISIQLDPTEVGTLRGDNVIFADCGDITNCEYRADLKMYIDKVVGA